MLLRSFRPQPFVCDAQGVQRDPTGTADLRRRLRATAQLRWSGLRKLVHEAIFRQNMLGLGASTSASLAASYVGSALGLGGNTDAKIKSFQMWFDNTLKLQVVGQNGGWMEPTIVTVYDKGVKTAQALAKTTAVPMDRSDKIAALQSLCLTELQGIVEAVSQQSVRAVAYAVLHNYKPIQLFRAIADRIEKVGVVRTNAMLDMMVVKTYALATLGVYRAAGIKQVSLLPEYVPPKPSKLRAASIVVRRDEFDPLKHPRGEHGQFATEGSEEHIMELSRMQRNVEERLRKLQAGEAFKREFSPEEHKHAAERIQRHRMRDARKKKIPLPEMVEVLTAGDDNVCPICEDISDDGPYTLDEAEDLIPAHPHCRCAFVPFFDLRFANVRA
jgi:hypothetical protein